MLLEIFLDSLFGFADVNSEKDQALGCKLFPDFVDKGRFIGAEAAPCGPELEQRHFALDGIVGELFAGGGCGGKMRSGFFVLGAGCKTESVDQQSGAKCAAEEDNSHAHGRKITQNGDEGLGLGTGVRHRNARELPSACFGRDCECAELASGKSFFGCLCSSQVFTLPSSLLS